jgi:hypothetical protein
MQATLANSHPTNGATLALLDGSDVNEALAAIRRPVAVVNSAYGPRTIVLDGAGVWLGDRSFTATHGVRFP